MWWSLAEFLGKFLSIHNTLQLPFIVHCQSHLKVICTCHFHWLSIPSSEYWGMVVTILTITITWNYSCQPVITLALINGFHGSWSIPWKSNSTLSCWLFAVWIIFFSWLSWHYTPEGSYVFIFLPFSPFLLVSVAYTKVSQVDSQNVIILISFCNRRLKWYQD